MNAYLPKRAVYQSHSEVLCSKIINAERCKEEKMVLHGKVILRSRNLNIAIVGALLSHSDNLNLMTLCGRSGKSLDRFEIDTLQQVLSH